MGITLEIFEDDRGSYSVVEWVNRPESESPPPGPGRSANVTRSGSAGADGNLWEFEQAVASPLGIEPVLSSRLLQLYLYHPTNVEEILEFDRRITERYSTYFSEYGEHYAGTFTCDRLGSDWIAEWIGWEYDDRHLGMAALDALDTPQDVQDIVAECGTLQDRDRPRHSLWLKRK